MPTTVTPELASVEAVTTAPTYSITSVTITPLSPVVAPSTVTPFSATVIGTNATQTVTWTSSAGSIDSSGNFTAPAVLAASQFITITATSIQDTSKTATTTAIIIGTSSITVTSDGFLATNDAFRVTRGIAEAPIIPALQASRERIRDTTRPT